MKVIKRGIKRIFPKIVICPKCDSILAFEEEDLVKGSLGNVIICAVCNVHIDTTNIAVSCNYVICNFYDYIRGDFMTTREEMIYNLVEGEFISLNIDKDGYTTETESKWRIDKVELQIDYTYDVGIHIIE